MSKWDDDFEGHDVHAALKRVRENVSSLRGTKVPTVELLQRMATAERFVRDRLSTADPMLIAVGQLDTLEGIVRALADDLDSHKLDGGGAHWANAVSRVDPMVQSAMMIPQIVSVKDVKSVHEAVVRFRRSAGQYLSRIGGEVEKLERQTAAIADLQEKQEQVIADQRAALDTLIDEFRSNTEELDQEYREAFSAFLATSEKSVQAAIEGYSETLDDAVADTSGTLEAAVASATSRLDQLHSDGEKAHKSALSKSKKDAESAIAEINKLKDDARESVGLIASTGMAGGYEKTANEEKIAADRWRIVASSAFAGMIAIAVMIAFYPTFADRPLTWPAFAAKAYVSFACGLLAAYAGREAERHRTSERQNRKRSLELRSLNPYLEPLDKRQQTAIRAVVADRIFGREDVASGAQENGGNAMPTILDVLKLVLGGGKDA